MGGKNEEWRSHQTESQTERKLEMDYVSNTCIHLYIQHTYASVSPY